MLLQYSFFTALLCFAVGVQAACDSYSPAFQLPKLSPKDPIIKKAHVKIQQAIDESYADLDSNTTSFSVEVTSSTATLFSIHQTAAEQDSKRPGTLQVDGTSRYRIASVTKAFTVLAIIQQQIAGKISLDDPINKYIPELGEKGKGLIPWKDISVRALASQLSGIPRDIALQEFITKVGDDPTKYGLPEISREGLLSCGEYSNHEVPCTAKDLLSYLDKKEPLFAPKQQSTYSNMNFILLGLAVENVTGMSYENYVEEHILKELKLTSTSFTRPDDEVSVLPKGASDFWNVDLGVQKATGGLYSTSADLAKYIRYVLTHYNGLTPALNWLLPQSYGTGLNSFYGTPWEILRTTTILSHPHTSRPVTFVNKGGSLPAYKTVFSMVPEYGFGFTVLVAGDNILHMRIANIVGEIMVQAAEEIAQGQSRDAHVGVYAASGSKKLNSSIEIAHSNERGLYVEAWTSNSTDALHGYLDLIDEIPNPGEPSVRLQLVPTLLYKDETKKRGEIWRLVPVVEDDRRSEEDGHEMFELFENLCMTDVDYASYGGVPLNEVVFWDEDESGRFGTVGLTGYRVKLGREEKERSDGGRRPCGNGADGKGSTHQLPDDSQQPMFLTDGLGNVFGENW